MGELSRSFFEDFIGPTNFLLSTLSDLKMPVAASRPLDRSCFVSSSDSILSAIGFGAPLSQLPIPAPLRIFSMVGAQGQA